MRKRHRHHAARPNLAQGQQVVAPWREHSLALLRRAWHASRPLVDNPAAIGLSGRNFVV